MDKCEHCAEPTFKGSFPHIETSPEEYETLQKFINILPFLPLRHYLDRETKASLRLVCTALKTIMDFIHRLDSTPQKCRWGSPASNSALAWSALGSLPTTEGCLRSATTIHIFDLNIQDLKRIFSMLNSTDLQSCSESCIIFAYIVEELKAHPFQEFKENYLELNLMDLPFEIHEKILSLCHSSDRQRLRHVSKLMQYQVDTLAGVEVHMNDLKWGWKKKCGKLPPASSLVISNLENVKSLRYFLNDDNCMLLTRVTLDGRFPAKGFIHLLDRCKNLCYIGFTHALKMESLENELKKCFPVRRLPMELPSLRALELKLQQIEFEHFNVFKVHSWTWVNAFEMMKPGLFHMPKLSSFSLCEESIVTHNLMYEVAEKVMKFILSHRTTLKYISVILNGNCIRTCNCPPLPIQIDMDQLHQLRLEKFSHDCDWRISRPFTAILQAQQDLKEITCFKLSDWEFYAGVISMNKWTLRTVRIEKNLAPEIDLEVFSECMCLENLWISQYTSTSICQQNCNVRSIRVDQRLTNLDLLPVSIKSLHILDQTVEASQIKTIPQRLVNLEVLDLQFLGSWDGRSFGLEIDTIQEILHLRKLNALFLEEIRTIHAHLTDSFESSLSQINLIPVSCSQIIKHFGCVVYGIMIAKSLPKPDYMPEWQQRASCYMDNSVVILEDFYIPDQ